MGLFNENEATPLEIERARELYGTDEIEIDEGAAASIGDSGTWVAAWVLVPTDPDRENDNE